MTFTVRVLIGLIAGFALGIAVSATGVPWLARVPAFVEPFGILFVNAIRMTVLPLVVASLIVGVISTGDVRTVGRLSGRAIVVFVVAVATAAVFAAACAFPLLSRLDIDPAVAMSLRASAAQSGQGAAPTAQQLPSVSQWLIELLPSNAIKAAADGTILPLILFALLFGLALTRVADAPRQTVLYLFKGIADGMLTLVGWVLQLTPVGVFALAVPLAARMGIAAAGALVYYIVLLSIVSAAFIVLVLYPAAVLVGRVPLRQFARACAPAQVVAFTSRSSLAALPATIKGARDLGLSDEIASFFIPLAASMFRVGPAMMQTIGVLFVARLYDVTLSAAQLATIILTVIPTTFTVPGIPAGAVIVMAPVLQSAGVPVEGIGILIGIDTIPDMFRTMANVTGWLGGGAILSRSLAPASKGDPVGVKG